MILVQILHKTNLTQFNISSNIHRQNSSSRRHKFQVGLIDYYYIQHIE